MLSRRRRSAAAHAERREGDEEAGAGADPSADGDEERHVRRRGGGRCRRLRSEADRRIRASLEAAQRRQPLRDRGGGSSRGLRRRSRREHPLVTPDRSGEVALERGAPLGDQYVRERVRQLRRTVGRRVLGSNGDDVARVDEREVEVVDAEWVDAQCHGASVIARAVRSGLHPGGFRKR